MLDLIRLDCRFTTILCNCLVILDYRYFYLYIS